MASLATLVALEDHVTEIGIAAVRDCLVQPHRLAATRTWRRGRAWRVGRWCVRHGRNHGQAKAIPTLSASKLLIFNVVAQPVGLASHRYAGSRHHDPDANARQDGNDEFIAHPCRHPSAGVAVVAGAAVWAPPLGALRPPEPSL
jgi:hypothetical protein